MSKRTRWGCSVPLDTLDSSITLFTRPESRSVSSTMTFSWSVRLAASSPVRSRTVSA